MLWVGVVALILAIPGGLTWYTMKQERLNLALFAAIQHDNTQEMISLLQQGADPNADEVQHSNRPVWQSLVDFLRGRRIPATTPLLFALRLEFDREGLGIERRENVPLVKALLDHGANINIRTRSGESPLWLAILNQHFEIAHLLLARGANPRERITRASNSLGFVLEDAAQYCNSDLMTDLLDHGAEVNMQDSDGTTALYMAAQSGCVDGVRVLLSHHANPNLTNRQGKTCIKIARQMLTGQQAFRSQYQQLINLLKQAGARQ